MLYRVNAGGSQVVATDGGPDWAADTTNSNNPNLVNPGSNSTTSFPAVEPGSNVPASTPGSIFDTERWDNTGGAEMQWAFDTPVPGLYEVRLYFGNGFNGTKDAGKRVFDVAIEGNVLANLDNIDLSRQFGHLVGGAIANVVEVTDGTLNINFLHGVENPLVNGIEIIQLGSGTPEIPTVSIVGSPYTEVEGGGQVQISLLTSTTVPSNEVVEVTFEIVPDTATPLQDYAYLSPTATFNQQTGVYTDKVAIAGSSSDATFLIDILQDTIQESNEAFTVNITGVSPNAGIGVASASVAIQDDDGQPSLTGAAVLAITATSNNVQISNFGSNSFQITNTGEKNIARVDIDVTNALYPDSVFDPFGLAGDTASKGLTINTNGSTGIVAPSNSSYIGAGGTAGFEAIRLVFDENVNGGFAPGESLGFSIDMDPNSVAGAQKSLLDAGSNPVWDVGGVSGAELIGSTFTVTFTDGTTATGQLQGAGNQAGARALATQDASNLSVALTVNGLGAGSIGTYDANGPSVLISGPVGQKARVVLTKGFIQPVTNEFFNGNANDRAYAPTLQAQLDALAASDFPANNAVEFQTVDILLTGQPQDISNQFNFSGVQNFNFDGEDRLPLGFVASVVDPANSNLPLGAVTQPIYLQFTEQEAVASNLVTDPIGNSDSAIAPSRIEAEDADILTNYRIENISAASGGRALGLSGGDTNEVGSAVFDFQGSAGTYDIVIGTFDENDGLARFVLELDDIETSTTTEIGTVELNATLGSSAANAQTFVTPKVATGIGLTLAIASRCMALKMAANLSNWTTLSSSLSSR
ncbi:MAG: hypothetical protein HC925_06950 [Coleofasciculaceae cyanobacterium SM2_3_26]|nr:hypothetical protein [Coleofasciculaceae cyanobacterium SM2_3_26]